ncbi:cell division protein FtsB [Zwartia sp.]|uniref:cell division protein FtsB n=1 Tax=Zwartia sp. TaxID=2978004 RepID=UPI00271570A3|nr:cell division protein FtsB [Zwartia sp.]MDO9024971.1 cell division protein FtsB [Zwartia sp.]
MRLLLVVLIALVGLIQYPLWMGRGGWFSVWDMQAQVVDQRMINEGLTARNVALAAEIEDLRSGTEASEERARSELGMMRQGEVFVQVLPPGVKPPELKVTGKPAVTAKPGGAQPASQPAPQSAPQQNLKQPARPPAR